MRTANLAIVFTDIQGFTERTSQQSYEENARMLRIHAALLDPLFKAFDGRKVKTIGDAYLVVFESPTRAVLCGMAIQDRLWAYNQRASEKEALRIRVVASQGEVRLEKGDVFGEAVNVAARIEGLAEPGEVLFTEAVYLAMNRAEVPAEIHGEHTLKGIPEPVKVYRAARGVYRLEGSETHEATDDSPKSDTSTTSSPPYGGHALGRVDGLVAPDPEILAAHEALAAKLTRGLPGLPTSRSKRLAGLALAVGLLSIVLCFALFGGDPVLTAIENGDLAVARERIASMPADTRRSFLRSRLHEAEGKVGTAIRGYEAATNDGSDRAFERLIELTKRPECATRQGAARALGRIGRPEARSALEALTREETDEDSEHPDDSVLGRLGTRLGLRCDPDAAARWALHQLKE